MSVTKTLGLIDLHNVFWSRYHASGDEELSAAQKWTVGFVLGQTHEYDYLAVCTDTPPYKRSEAYPEYKATREAPSPMALEQLKQTVERLQREGIRVYKQPGYEADDLIATFVRYTGTIAEAAGCGVLDVTIISNDGDLLQLVDPGVRQLARTSKGAQVYDVDTIQAKLGINPTQVLDWKTLQGDKSDNIPGVERVGKKVAAWLIQEFGSLETVIECAMKQPTRFGGKKALCAAIREAAPNLLKWRSLLVLRDDAAIDVASVVVPLERTAEPAAPPELQGPIDGMDEFDDPRISGDNFDDGPGAPPQSEPSEPRGRAQTESGPDAAEEPASSTAIVRRLETKVAGPRWSQRLEPRGPQQLWALAEHIAKVRWFSQKFNGPGEIALAIMAGREHGLGVFSSLKNIYVHKGRPALMAYAIIGKAKSHPDCEYFQMVKSTKTSATWATKRRGYPRETEFTFELSQAQEAGLVKHDSAWHKWPNAMCIKQAGVMLARAEYADTCSALISVEELSEGRVYEVEYEQTA